ncbi:MAG: hypothetical protein Q9174_006425 [Haloplaca sp. 1 TL-2023]
MAEQEDETLEERLKAALWFSVGKIVDEETLKLGVNATPQFIGALTELVWSQIENVSQDLRAFAQSVMSNQHMIAEAILTILARHAGRKTVSSEDVMVLARRNEELAALLGKSLPKATAAKTATSKRR